VRSIVLNVDDEAFRILTQQARMVENSKPSQLEWCAIGILKKLERGDEKATIAMTVEPEAVGKPAVPNAAV
jgi:hypothetical protein